MSRKVDRQRGQTKPDDHGVPRLGVLPATVQENHLGRFVAPLDRADRARADAPHRRQRPAHPDLFGVFVKQPELGEAGQVVIGNFGVRHAVEASPR